MSESVAGDPRLAASAVDPDDIRPQVAGASRAPSIVLLAAGLVLAAVLLFIVLESRRQALQAPAVSTRAAPSDAIPAGEPPVLYIPPAPAEEASAAPSAAAPQSVPFVLPEPPTRQPRIDYAPQPAPQVIIQQPQLQPLPPPPTAELPAAPRTALVIDRSGPQEGAGGGAGGEAAAAAQPAGGRVTAGVLVNRSTTVAQGTLIPAVLETGLDSTKPGFARAIVSRDVRSFDGTRILIPRGSRLTGGYEGGAESGQKRAIISWTRLVRPDGVTIAIGSPATDAVGRNGVRARVNSHLLARIFPAILQSALDIGVNLASRPANGGVLLALPNAGTSSISGQGGPTPTLSVRPGTSIAVFVTRDLDFTGVGNPQ